MNKLNCHPVVKITNFNIYNSMAFKYVPIQLTWIKVLAILELELTQGLCVFGAARFADRPRDFPLVDEALLQLVVVEERVQVEH